MINVLIFCITDLCFAKTTTTSIFPLLRYCCYNCGLLLRSFWEIFCLAFCFEIRTSCTFVCMFWIMSLVLLISFVIKDVWHNCRLHFSVHLSIIAISSHKVQLATTKYFSSIKLFFKKKLHGFILWMGFNGLKAKEPLHGGSSLFTTKFPKIHGTHVIDLRRMKSWVDLGATQWFWTLDPWIPNLVS